jgi:hypothetical protein
MSEIDPNSQVILVDRVEEIVVDGGALRPMDSEAQVRKDRGLLRELEKVLGASEQSWRRLPGTRTKSHQFGGHEIVTQTVEIIFALGSAGMVKHGFATIQSWLQAKKGRHVIIEEKLKGGTTRRIDISGYSEKDVQKILAAKGSAGS